MSKKNLKPETARARRKLLKLAATGGTAASVSAYAGNWAKPVVDSVILPAHATTTDDSASSTRGSELREFYGETTILSPQTGAKTDGLLDLFLSQAHAGGEAQQLQIQVKVLMVETTTANQFGVRLLFDEPIVCRTQGLGRYVGYVNGLVSGGNGNLSSAACPGTIMSNTFSVQFTYNVSGSMITMNGAFFGYLPFNLVLSLGNNFPSVPSCVECLPVMDDQIIQ